jgi:hypothetical protein
MERDVKRIYNTVEFGCPLNIILLCYDRTRVWTASFLRILYHAQLDTRTHTHTHAHKHPVGLLWTSDQLVAAAAIYTTQN